MNSKGRRIIVYGLVARYGPWTSYWRNRLKKREEEGKRICRIQLLIIIIIVNRCYQLPASKCIGAPNRELRPWSFLSARAWAASWTALSNFRRVNVTSMQPRINWIFDACLGGRKDLDERRDTWLSSSFLDAGRIADQREWSARLFDEDNDTVVYESVSLSKALSSYLGRSWKSSVTPSSLRSRWK